jgi:hypothetical protein
MILNSEKIELISDIYDNWSSVKPSNLIKVNEKYNFLTELVQIKFKKEDKVEIFCNEIEGLKVILYYDKNNLNYFAALKNEKELIYVFDNSEYGFSILENKKIIQENMSFLNHLEKTKKDILVEVDDKLYLYKTLIKNLSNKFNVENTIKQSTSLVILKESNVEEEVKIIEKTDFEDNKKEPTIGFIEEDSIIEIKEEEKFQESVEDVKVEMSFCEKIKELTGISVSDNIHCKFSNKDVYFLNIEYNSQDKIFNQVLSSLILKSNGFKSNQSDLLILNNFFQYNDFVPSNEICLFLKESYMDNKGSVSSYLTSDNELIWSTFNSNLRNNIIISYELENKKEYKLKLFNYLGEEFVVVEGNEILTSDFFLSFEDINGVEGLTYFDHRCVIGGNVFFKKYGKRDISKFAEYVGFKTNVLNSLNILEQKLTINNENLKVLSVLDISNKENILSSKHKYVFDNLKDFLMGYLSNSDLHYSKNPSNEKEKTQKESLELLFKLKDFYIEDVSELSDLKDTWSDKRKVNKMRKFISSIRSKILNHK